MFCPKCGAETLDDSQFCRRCGQRSAVAVTSIGAGAAVAPATDKYMENETSKTRSLQVAFLLDPPSLRNLQTLLSEIKGSLEYKVKFSDGSTTKYSDVDEITKLSNAGKKCIVAIIASVEGRPGHSAFLTMRGDPEPSVEYTLTGGQRDVGYFADKLDDWIASCTQWYSTFYSSNVGLLVGVGLIALPIFLMVRMAKVFPSSKAGWQSYLPMITLIGVSVGEYWASKLFPRATFAIEYGARRNRLFSVIRVSVLLAIVITLLGDWLVQHL